MRQSRARLRVAPAIFLFAQVDGAAYRALRLPRGFSRVRMHGRERRAAPSEPAADGKPYSKKKLKPKKVRAADVLGPAQPSRRQDKGSGASRRSSASASRQRLGHQRVSRKKENRQPKRGIGEEDRVPTYLHEQDFGRTIRGTGGALLLLTRDTTGSQRGARWRLPTPLAVSSQSRDLPPASHWQPLV